MSITRQAVEAFARERGCTLDITEMGQGDWSYRYDVVMDAPPGMHFAVSELHAVCCHGNTWAEVMARMQDELRLGLEAAPPECDCMAAQATGRG